MQLVALLAARVVQLVLFTDAHALLRLRDELTPHDGVLSECRAASQNDAVAEKHGGVLGCLGEPIRPGAHCKGTIVRRCHNINNILGHPPFLHVVQLHSTPGGGTPYTEVYMYVPRKCPCFWPFFSLCP